MIPDSEPFTPAMIARYLRGMTPSELAKAHPYMFQQWPTRNIVKGAVILELIANEKARRKRHEETDQDNA